MKNESHSNLVNTVHTAYFNNNNVVYKDNDGEYAKSDLSQYLDIYGVNPFDESIEGYEINGGAITSVTKLESETDYKFKISFDPEIATNNVKIQMRKFGDLDDYPKFKSIDIIITIKNDFTPVKLELSSKYTAKKFMDSDCEQNYTVTYSDFNSDISIPGLESIKELFI